MSVPTKSPDEFDHLWAQRAATDAYWQYQQLQKQYEHEMARQTAYAANALSASQYQNMFMGGAGGSGALGISNYGQSGTTAIQGQEASASQRPSLGAALTLLDRELNQPAMTAPLDTLDTLWLAKYSNDWVVYDSLPDDEDFFWPRAAKRLISAGRIERVYIVDSGKNMVRRPA